MKLALGTVQFGLKYGINNVVGQVSRTEAKHILDVARSAGINTLDTAVAYGESEFELGGMGVGDWQIVTKLPALPPDCQNVHDWVWSQVQGSLQRLRVKSLYGLLLHRPDQIFEKGGTELLQALQVLKMQGLVEKIGISIYAPEELGKIFDVAHFDIVQAPLNVLDRRLVDTGWAARLKSVDVEIHTRSSFLQGLLLMTDEGRPQKFDRWGAIWKTWSKWLAENKLSPLHACVLYPLSIQQVDRVVVGVDSAVQMNQILAASSGSLRSLPEWPVEPDLELLNPAMWGQL